MYAIAILLKIYEKQLVCFAKYFLCLNVSVYDLRSHNTSKNCNHTEGKLKGKKLKENFFERIKENFQDN